METIANVEPVAVCARVMQIFFGSFIFGEDINFGYPVCWQGVLVFLAIYGVVFGFGYWYIFVHAY